MLGVEKELVIGNLSLVIVNSGKTNECIGGCIGVGPEQVIQLQRLFKFVIDTDWVCSRFLPPYFSSIDRDLDRLVFHHAKGKPILRSRPSLSSDAPLS